MVHLIKYLYKKRHEEIHRTKWPCDKRIWFLRYFNCPVLINEVFSGLDVSYLSKSCSRCYWDNKGRKETDNYLNNELPEIDKGLRDRLKRSNFNTGNLFCIVFQITLQNVLFSAKR